MQPSNGPAGSNGPNGPTQPGFGVAGSGPYDGKHAAKPVGGESSGFSDEFSENLDRFLQSITSSNLSHPYSSQSSEIDAFESAKAYLLRQASTANGLPSSDLALDVLLTFLLVPWEHSGSVSSSQTLAQRINQSKTELANELAENMASQGGSNLRNKVLERLGWAQTRGVSLWADSSPAAAVSGAQPQFPSSSGSLKGFSICKSLVKAFQAKRIAIPSGSRARDESKAQPANAGAWGFGANVPTMHGHEGCRDARPDTKYVVPDDSLPSVTSPVGPEPNGSLGHPMRAAMPAGLTGSLFLRPSPPSRSSSPFVPGEALNSGGRPGPDDPLYDPPRTTIHYKKNSGREGMGGPTSPTPTTQLAAEPLPLTPTGRPPPPVDPVLTPDVDTSSQRNDPSSTQADQRQRAPGNENRPSRTYKERTMSRPREAELSGLAQPPKPGPGGPQSPGVVHFKVIHGRDDVSAVDLFTLPNAMPDDDPQEKDE
jgi:hypothetical protein